MTDTAKTLARSEAFECFKVIDSCLSCYYGGETHMYRPIAGQLRILFCNTDRGRYDPLLLRAFSEITLQRVRPILWHDPQELASQQPLLAAACHGIDVPDDWIVKLAKMPFVATVFTNGLAIADLELEDEGPLVPLASWVKLPVTSHPGLIRIWDIIRSVADKGGGAHVDPTDSRELALLRQLMPGQHPSHILFTVALGRFAQTLGLHLLQVHEQYALGGSQAVSLDENAPSVKNRAVVPEPLRSTGAASYHLFSLRRLG